MLKKLIALTLLLSCALAVSVKATPSQNPQVIIHTNKGPITLELYADKAPITVANFLAYANAGFYQGTIFHRVIKRFMIQGGGFTQEMNMKETSAPIINEANNGLHNDRWTIAMARTADPDSATSQFFINTKMNSSLDPRGKTPGYTVFGIVTDGQYVVEAIEKTPVTAVSIFQNLPIEPVIIERVEVKPDTKNISSKTKERM